MYLMLSAMLLWLAAGEPAGSGQAAAAVPAALKKEPPLRLSPVNEQPVRTPSLAECRSRGFVRFVLVWPSDSAPHDSPLAELARRADRFAESLGVMSRLVRVDSPSELLQVLREQRADVVLTPMRVFPAEGIHFVALAERVRIVLAGRLAAESAPISLKEAAQKTIRLADSPVAAWMLGRLESLLGFKPRDAAVAAGMDEEQVLDGVASGSFDLAVVKSDQLDLYRQRCGDIEELFTLEEQVPMAWAVSQEAADLAAAVERFFEEQELTSHLKQEHVGDLEQVRNYGALRVAMLNNAVAYFVYRGQQVGFQFEIAALLARRLGLRLEVVVPRRPADTLRLLLDGQVDVAIASPPSDEQLRSLLLFSQPFHWSNQVLVQRAGEEPVQQFEQLMWRTLYVRRSSQYWPTVTMLATAIPYFTVRPAAEDLETEELIAMVGKGDVPLTVSNSVLLAAEMASRDDVQGTLVLARQRPLVFVTRADAPRLMERIERFVTRDCRGKWFDGLVNKYLMHSDKITQVRSDAFYTNGAISPYDELVRRYAEKNGVDWRLVVAQMFQESRFDPLAVSWMGAEGLLQLMPLTSRDMGVTDPFDPEQNIKAGVTYLANLMKRFEPALSRRQRIRFALAAYNAGLEHVRDARQLAWRMGLDSNRWFGNVERAMLLLEKPEYFQQLSHGYCRGTETVGYVSSIQTRYDAFVRLAPAHVREKDQPH